jgi:hypothetical protein
LKRNYPDKFIYEPWKASLSQQQQWGCVIGEDYPHPIVDHDIVSKVNMMKMKEAYANQNMNHLQIAERKGHISLQLMQEQVLFDQPLSTVLQTSSRDHEPTAQSTSKSDIKRKYGTITDHLKVEEKKTIKNKKIK